MRGQQNRRRGGGNRGTARDREEKFLHANFHFVLDGLNAPYTALARDSDAFCAWDDILEVRLLQPAECAICLSPPVAPQLTRCGHIFCFPCILHHISYSATPGCCACPLCNAFVSKRDLRPVCMPSDLSPPEIGSPMSFSLLQRKKGSCIPVPPPYFAKFDGPKLPLYDRDYFACFSHFSICRNWGFVVARQRKELLASLEEFSQYDDDSAIWIEMALEELETWKNMMRDRKKTKHIRNAQTIPGDAPSRTVSDDGPDMFAQVKEYTLPEEHDAARALDAEKTWTVNLADKSSYTCYQASDGSLSFLSKVVMDMLVEDGKRRSGEDQKAVYPLQFTGTVKDIRTIRFDANARRSNNVLGYLPTATIFNFIEVDVKDVLLPETYAMFEAKIKAREAMRKIQAEKAAAERKIIQDTKMCPDVILDMSEFVPLGDTPPPMDSFPDTLPSRRVEEPQEVRMSYSEVIKTGKTKKHEEDFPSLGFPELTASAPSVMVTPPRKPTPKQTKSKRAVVEEEEEEDLIAEAPSFHDSFSHDYILKEQDFLLRTAKENASGQGASGGKKNKKKKGGKNKGTLLFSTGGGFHS